jgi:hypothetical protein
MGGASLYKTSRHHSMKQGILTIGVIIETIYLVI